MINIYFLLKYQTICNFALEGGTSIVRMWTVEDWEMFRDFKARNFWYSLSREHSRKNLRGWKMIKQLKFCFSEKRYLELLTLQRKKKKKKKTIRL